MSELINKSDNRTTIRWKLLTGASALALTAYVSSMGVAVADDADHPQIWIEAGGQLDRLDSTQTVFAPPFFDLATPKIRSSMIDAQRPSPFSIDETGKISFEPENSDWIFSAAIRYGKAVAARHNHHQTHYPTPANTVVIGTHYTRLSLTQHRSEFGDGQTRLTESHLQLDFMAGKDVGLGMFGAHGSSVVSAGVRIAQFTSSSNVTLHARPVLGYHLVSGSIYYGFIHYKIYQPNHATYTAVLNSRHESRGIGPSISWDASLPFAGNSDGAEFSFDWGVNAALLFGRQHTRVHHQTTGKSYNKTGGLFLQVTHTNHYTHPPVDRNRSRDVTVPNVGGVLSMSLKFPNAKISIGYRGDFFFGAMDQGIDTRKTGITGFYGPFASVSFGIGD